MVSISNFVSCCCADCQLLHRFLFMDNRAACHDQCINRRQSSHSNDAMMFKYIQLLCPAEPLEAHGTALAKKSCSAHLCHCCCRAGLVTVLLAVGATLIFSTSQLGQ